MVTRRRCLEAEGDGLGRGDLRHNCEAIIEGIGRETTAVSHGGRLGAGWCNHEIESTRSRTEREGPYRMSKEGGQGYPESVKRNVRGHRKLV